MSNAELRVDRARWWALQNQPFYGSLAMSLTDVFTSRIPTAATDGKVIKWNPGFVDTLTDEELRFVLLHETLHCAHQHMWRLPTDTDGNIAGDHEINLTLARISGMKMPEGGLADPQYENLSCEEILSRIRKPAEPEPEPEPEPDSGDEESESDPESGSGSGSESGGGSGSDDSDDTENGSESGSQSQQDGSESSDTGGSGDEDTESSDTGGGGGSGGSPAAADPCGSFEAPAAADPDATDEAAAAAAEQALREDWQQRVIQAAQASQAAGIGSMPSDMERLLDKLRHVSVDWRQEMADFVRDAMSTRNDWSRASRRHAWQSVIYPRRRADEVGTVIFARDTSGSVDDNTCAAYSALITDCISETGCRGLVLDVDTQIQAEYELDGFDTCPLTAKGGGGTDFRPVFNRADEMVAAGEHIAGIVYLTDLQGPAPKSTEHPTLWLVNKPYYYRTIPPAPFGRAVEIEV
jgi:predicted metal-dependent peptidase